MELGRALDQISAIHDHLSRGEVFRGLRPLTVAGTGVLALVVAAIFPYVGAAKDGRTFLGLWLGAAGIALAICAAEVLWNYFAREDDFSRRRTVRVVGQFVPCLAAGAMVTVLLASGEASRLHLLPGLWAVLFALGIFSARPYLPHESGFVALFYLVAGGCLLALGPASLSAWGMGLAFGVGQLGAALVLHRDRERRDA